MSYATVSTVEYGQYKSCSQCSCHLEPQAKFCGSCGYIVAPNSFNINEYPEQQARLISLEQAETKVPKAVPAFAVAQVAKQSAKTAELNQEAARLHFLLARERVFLYMHLLTFLAINLFGCWVAWKCYYDFIGDDMSKMMIASTPFLFINSLALLVIVPIKGTRTEIARLKERISCVRFNVEFGHLNL